MHHIREANINDVKAICEIAEQTWWHTYSPILSDDQIRYMLDTLYAPEVIHRQIRDKELTYLILSDDEAGAGFAGFCPRDENPEIYKLHKLYCLPQTQCKGYGKLLINQVINYVLNAGKHTLDLNVNRQNKAKSFYEKLGFSVIYEEDLPIGPYWMNDFVMRKTF